MFRFSHLLIGFPAFRKFDKWLGRAFTSSGKVLLAAIVFFLVGSIHLDTPVYILAGAAISLLLVAFAVNRVMRPTLLIHAAAPKFVQVDDPFKVWCELENTGPRDAMDLNLMPVSDPSTAWLSRQNEEPLRLNRLESSKSSVVPFTFRATRRGAYSIPNLEVATTYPLNLCKLSRLHELSTDLLVVPQRKRIAAIDCVFIAAGLLAGENASTSNDGIEQFAGSREYVPGIAAKRWDHQTWARLGIPHVCMYEKEAQSNTALILDLSQCSDPRTCEAAVTLMWSVASLLGESGHALGSLTVGEMSLQLQGDVQTQSEEIGIVLARVDLQSAADRAVPNMIFPAGTNAVVIAPVESDLSYHSLRFEFGIESVEVLVADVEEPRIHDLQISVKEIEEGATW